MEDVIRQEEALQKELLELISEQFGADALPQSEEYLQRLQKSV
jgi:hypothetical protein